MSEIPIIGQSVPRVTGRVTIVRSFSYKLNVGNYESREFFASQKAECDAADAEAISEAVYKFVKKEVMKAVSEYRAEAAQRSAGSAREVEQRRTG